jgi:hypothetical protein
VTSTKKQKMKISRSIVEAVRSLEPPGRFLEKDQGTGKWYDIGDKKAVEKTSQALRDGAASLRKQLSQDLGDPDFLSVVFDEVEPKDVSPASAAVGNKKPAEKKKPPAKGHRRTMSNPTVLAATRAKVVIKKHRMEVPMSPNRMQLHLPPQSPMSPSSRMSPRSMGPPSSPRLGQMAHPARRHGHRRGHSMPTVPYPMPRSPIYHDYYQFGRVGSKRGGSFEWGPEHHDHGPSPSLQYGPPSSPSFHPLQSPGSHHPHHHHPHSYPPASPGYGRPQPHAVYQPPVSPRWSPHLAFNRGGPSLSPYPYLHPGDVQHARSPDFRPPLGLSPRPQYSRGGSGQCGSSSSLSVPTLGGEQRTQSHPLPMSPLRYPPPSPRFCPNQSPTESPYMPSSPIQHEFAPPLHQQPRRRSPVGSFSNRMESPVECENEFGSDGESEYGPEDEEMQDRRADDFVKSADKSVKSLTSKNTFDEKSESPAAVVDVVSSEDLRKPEISISPMKSSKVNNVYRDANDYPDFNPSRDDDYPSDEDPIPFDQQEDPSSLMDLPANLLSMPISPFGPNDFDM